MLVLRWRWCHVITVYKVLVWIAVLLLVIAVLRSNHLGINLYSLEASYLHTVDCTNYTRYDETKVKLKFLPQFHNPCIVEKKSDSRNWVYTKNKFSKYGKLRNHNGNIFTNTMANITEGVIIKSKFCHPEEKCRLRCLPRFMLLGVAKCGTTDFFTRAMFHPNIFCGIRKELFYWSQWRFQINASVGDYMDLFDNSVPELLKDIRSDPETGEKFYPSVLSEYTSVEFTDDVFWQDHPLNKGLLEPNYTKPRYIHDINPGIKLIVLLRNPTTRLYSSYNFFKKSEGSAADFHGRVVASIEWWQNCTEQLKLPVRRCAYGCPQEMPPLVCVKSNGKSNNRWQGAAGNYSGELRRGMYSIFTRDWLSVFPREQLLFLRTEDNHDMLHVFNQQVLPFLNLDPITDEESVEVIGDPAKHHKQQYEPMWTKTRHLLNLFYRPFNIELAEILGDEKWTWNDCQ